MDNRSIEEILDEMLLQISNTEDTSENSFIHDALSPAAIEFFGVNRLIEDVYGKFDIENLEGGELDRFIHSRTGLTRRQPVKATTKVVITGIRGTRIEEGILVSAGEVEYVVTEDCQIGEGGSCTVSVEAVDAGTTGNVPADSIVDFPTSIIDLFEVYNPEPAINGVDRESDDSYRERYYNRLQRPGKAGNVFHYEEWANEVAGVGGARVFPLWDGALTVMVMVIDSNKLPASEDLVKTVDAHIQEQRPFGADVTIRSPEALDVNINVKVVKDDGVSVEDLESRINDNLKEHLAQIAFVGDYVSYARVGNVILNTDGVIDYSDLKINGVATNVTIDNKQVAVVGKVNITQ